MFPGMWNYTAPDRRETWDTSMGSSNFPDFGRWTVYNGYRGKHEQQGNNSSPSYPVYVTRFPMDIITEMDNVCSPHNTNPWDWVACADINNGSDVKTPTPLFLMAHTRLKLETSEEGSNKSWIPKGLRPELQEWSALSLCQVKRQISVVNGTLRSSTTTSSYLTGPKFSMLKDPTGVNVTADCYAPENVDLTGEALDGVLAPPVMSAGLDHQSYYRADPSTGAFCLFNGTDIERYQIYNRLARVLRYSIHRNATGHPIVDGLVDGRWERQPIHGMAGGTSFGPEFSDVPVRISNRTLGYVMSSVGASLNNLTLATTTERATGSYVVRERILVARWQWLTALFAIEFLGIGYFFFIVFRPRDTAGVWNDSIFAVLYHGLDDESKETHDGMFVRDLRGMKEAAKAMDVRLNYIRDNSRIALVHEPTTIDTEQYSAGSWVKNGYNPAV